MKIAFLTREYPPETAWGGIATVFHNLARALVERGHEVHVICQAVTRAGDLTERGVFIHRVGTNPKRYSATARINYSFYAWLKLRQVIKQYNIEIVEATCWGAEAFLYSLTKQTPLVIRLDVSASDLLRTKTYSGAKQFLSLKFLSYFEDFSTKRADRIIAISEELYNRAIKRLRIAPSKVDLVHHAVDTNIYRLIKSNIRYKLSISDNEGIVLTVCRLELRKGSHILCQAIPKIIKSVPAVKFVFVGQDTNTAPDGGSMKSYITEEAKSHGFIGNLLFINLLPLDELINLYSACDVFVLPSLQEGFSMATLEALACGKPVVTTVTGIDANIGLRPPNGILVPTNNANKLAEAIIKILTLKDEDKRMVAQQNRELIEARFSIKAWIDKVLKVYEKALSVTDGN